MSEDLDLQLIRQRKMAEIMAQKVTLPNGVVDITSIDQFNQLVNDFKEELIIVDMWAPWCGPCKAFGPIFKALQKDYEAKGVVFTKLNVDELGQVAQQFQVTGIPTTLFIRGKKLVHRQVGMLPKPQFAAVVDKIVAQKA